MIELDGAQGEGGGQILRTSLALSLITGKAFHLHNLRAGRSKPGLQPQHLMSVRAAATIGQAALRGATLGSQDLVFEPGTVQPGKYRFPIGTAGATGLVLHTVYLPLALAGGPSTVTIEGGTHVKASPCFHFLHTTWRVYLERLGLHVGLQMRRPGFYPRGGGLIQADIAPCPVLNGLNIDRIEPVGAATGFSAVAGLPANIAERQARRARYRLEKLGLQVDLDEQSWDGGPGTVVGIELATSPAPTFFFALGERGKPAERVADEAVDQVQRFVEAEPMGVDEHSADQVMLPLALAETPSHFPVAAVSSHLLTNVDVIRRFVERSIYIDGDLGRPGRVRLE
jgi:RNA 3'-terminal phosphate cyclase (ATP)